MASPSQEASAKHSEEKLRQISSDLLRLINTIPVLIHRSLPNGDMDFFNQTWMEYVGRPLEDLQGWKWTGSLHPDDVEGIVARWRACLASGEPFEHVARVRRADGEYRWMLHRQVALRDEQGRIIKWYGSSYDIEDIKRAEDGHRLTESFLIHAQRLTKAGTWAYKPPDICEYWSAELFRIFGFDPENGYPANDEMVARVHPEDRPHAVQALVQLFEQHREFDQKYRFIRPDGQVRVIRDFGAPVFENGVVTRFVGACMDITEQEQRIEELRKSGFYLAEGQRLAHMGSWGFNPAGFFEYWSPELFRIYGLAPAAVPPTLEEYLACVHPQDREFVAETIQKIVGERIGCDLKKRILRPDGEIRYIHCVGVPVIDSGILKSIVGTAIDITEEENLTQELRRREAYLAEAQRLSHTGSFGWNVTSGELLWSEETFRIFQYERTTTPSVELVLRRVHPEDAALVKQTIESASQGGRDFDFEHRLLMPDGAVKHLRIVSHALRSSPGNLEFVGAVTDITTTKRAAEKIRAQEIELRQILDFAPQPIFVLGPDDARVRLFANQAALNYYGQTLEEWQTSDRSSVFYPGDWDRMISAVHDKSVRGVPHEGEVRIRGRDGQYRWHLFHQNPLRDDQGRIQRWFVSAIDIEDRKQAEEKLQNENVALREEIDKASMFEEIVGTSPALQVVLSRISKVAPTDSTVLITGETGTGKELVARAIHRRSHRSARAFISVNCSAIPRDLIASELFGHEKGAFTGAMQRRVGRFELAGGGTIFLDEIGELPAETQVALLRVLQEHEFERVGGSRSIQADVRVIAATNRDLPAAITAGTFRSDLFYRLNVFPIEIPALRQRTEDLPLLVEYFLDRYGRKTGKSIRRVNKKTMELLRSYPWPGNIRELQNIVERSVILCETEDFSVDESWLSRKPSAPVLKNALEITHDLALHEREMIEAALRICGGRVFGPSGAAAKLGMPRSTLESKIRSLKINKNQFKN